MWFVLLKHLFEMCNGYNKLGYHLGMSQLSNTEWDRAKGVLISRLIWQKLEPVYRPRLLGPCVTNPADDNQIRLLHLRNRWEMATQTATEIPGHNNLRINAQTIRNRLAGHTRYESCD